jgi:6-phosphogluconolactonase
VTLTPDGQYALVADLGLDKIMVYRLDVEAGRLHPAVPQSAVALHAAAGPRHLAFHPNGRWLYVINELDSTLTTFAYEAGAFACLDNISTLPEGFAGTSYCADVHVHPNGRFLYGSNRGHDSILVAAIGEKRPAHGLSEITRPPGGRTPRNLCAVARRPLFAGRPTSDSDDNVVVFAITTPRGRPAPAAHRHVARRTRRRCASLRPRRREPRGRPEPSARPAVEPGAAGPETWRGQPLATAQTREDDATRLE